MWNKEYLFQDEHKLYENMLNFCCLWCSISFSIQALVLLSVSHSVCSHTNLEWEWCAFSSNGGIGLCSLTPHHKYVTVSNSSSVLLEGDRLLQATIYLNYHTMTDILLLQEVILCCQESVISPVNNKEHKTRLLKWVELWVSGGRKKDLRLWRCV